MKGAIALTRAYEQWDEMVSDLGVVERAMPRIGPQEHVDHVLRLAFVASAARRHLTQIGTHVRHRLRPDRLRSRCCARRYKEARHEVVDPIPVGRRESDGVGGDARRDNATDIGDRIGFAVLH